MADKKGYTSTELALFVKLYAQECVDKTGKNVKVVLDPEFAEKLFGHLKARIASWVHSFTPYADVPLKKDAKGNVLEKGAPDKQFYFEDFLGK